jgi:hypothetical protein
VISSTINVNPYMQTQLNILVRVHEVWDRLASGTFSPQLKAQKQVL